MALRIRCADCAVRLSRALKASAAPEALVGESSIIISRIALSLLDVEYPDARVASEWCEEPTTWDE